MGRSRATASALDPRMGTVHRTFPAPQSHGMTRRHGAVAATRSWQRALAFFDRHLR